MAFYLWDGKFLLEDGKFAVHEDCCCVSAITSGEYWYHCTSGATWSAHDLAATVPNNLISTDYAWLCIDKGGGSLMWPCYLSGYAPTSGTTLNYLVPCDIIPASCADLSGIPVADGFTGTVCDSESNSGFFHNFRWVPGGYGQGGHWDVFPGFYQWDWDEQRDITVGGAYGSNTQIQFTDSHDGFEIGTTFLSGQSANTASAADQLRWGPRGGVNTFPIVFYWSGGLNNAVLWSIYWDDPQVIYPNIPCDVWIKRDAGTNTLSAYYNDGGGDTYISKKTGISWAVDAIDCSTVSLGDAAAPWKKIIIQTTDYYALDTNGTAIALNPEGTNRGSVC